jgi:hypothetical protein
MRFPRLRGGHITRRCRRAVLVVATVGLLSSTLSGTVNAAETPNVLETSFHGDNGVTYTATNHLLRAAQGRGREWLLAWTGPDTPGRPDFMAVIDATPTSPSYGKVVNTVTMGPGTGNEPHHMQYTWSKGNLIYAGGILSDTTFVFDAKSLPALRLVGVNTPLDTPCGTMPDAYQVLPDGTAYGTMLGGPNAAGPCTYTNGQVRVGNGPGGSPGEIVHFGTQGQTLAEIPTASATAEDPAQCLNVPAVPAATCANPHGIAVRSDLHTMVTSDFVEAHSVPANIGPTNITEDDARISRQTVRVFDTTDENNPKLVSVSKVPDGPRSAIEKATLWDESRVLMETTVTHQRGHRGAFVSSMAGGAVYYTPDITVAHPVWREIFDDTTAYMRFHPDGSVTGSGDNASWLAVSPDDHYLYHAVMGQSSPHGGSLNTTTGMVYVLDISKLLAAGPRADCSISTLAEVYTGGVQSDCPGLTSVAPIRDTSDGGPHWGAMDDFQVNSQGVYHQTSTASRVVVSDYFLAGSFGGGGDHRICMYEVSRAGRLTLDRNFRDEYTHQPCVDFNRLNWPHGATGFSRAHGVLFVVSDGVLR